MLKWLRNLELSDNSRIFIMNLKTYTMTDLEVLLHEFTRKEIEQMSDDEKRLVIREIKDEMDVARCEQQMMNTCPQAIDPINY